MEEINRKVQLCEDEIYSGTLDENIIDIESFATQFLINSISLNFDSFKTSSYYYKLDNESKIYAGPCWDFDGAFAEYLHQGENWVNPEGSIFEGEERLEWYEILNNNTVFYECVLKQFALHSEEIHNLINKEIDAYAEYITEAVANDNLRWKFTDGTSSRAGTYQTWENDVRYLKFFLNKRMKYLSNLWGVEENMFEWNASGETHIVNFLVDGELIEVTKVLDGEAVQDFPEIEGAKWYFEYSGERYNRFLPILEDCTLVIEE